MAARFWVGGSGTWNASNTSNWSATSGGASGASVPTAADTVTIDTASGTGITCTLEAGYSPTVTTVTLTANRLNLNDNVLTMVTWSSNNSNTRGVDFGTTGRIDITGNNATVWTSATVTGLTYTGSRNVSFVYSGSTGTRTITMGALPESSSLNTSITGGSDLVGVSGSVRDLNFTGFSGTLITNSRTIFGNLTLTATMTLNTSSGVTTFAATSGTKTITTAGRVIDFPVTFNGVGGTFQLVDNYTGGSTITSLMTLTAGTLDLNGRTVNVFGFGASGSVARTLNATGATLNITGNAATVLNFITITNLTLTGLTTITFTYAGAVGNRTITSSTFTEAQSFNIVITGGSDTVILTGNMRNLDFTGFSGTLNNASRGIYGNLTLGSSMTVANGASVTSFLGTGTSTINTNGRAYAQAMTFSGGGVYQLLSSVDLSGRNGTLNLGTLELDTFSFTSFIFNSSTSTTRAINFGTSGVINVTGNAITVWGFPDARNFSYSGTAPRINATYAGATGTRNLTHGTTLGGSNATKAPPIHVTAGTDTVITTATSYFSDLVFTGSSSTLTNTARILYGNLVLSSGITLSAGANVTTFSGNITQTFDTATKTLDFPLTFGNGTSNGTVQLANNMVVDTARTVTLTSGGFDLNGKTCNIGFWSSNNTNTRTLDMTDSTMLLTNIGNVWNMSTSTGATVVAANSNIELTSTSTSSRTFAGGNLTYGNLIIGGTTGINFLTISGNNSFDTISSTKTVSHTLQFIAGSTTTVENFTVSGSEGNLVTITSTTNAPHNLVITGGDAVDSVGYLNISYSNASPTGRWLAGPGSVRGSTVTGWIFEQTGNWLTMF
jgi:hypothetical protein